LNQIQEENIVQWSVEEKMVNKKKILVLGYSGMLGHMVKSYMEKYTKYEVIRMNRKDFDARDSLKAFRTILFEDPDIIINCIGILNNDNDIQKYSDVNIIFPKLLANWCKENCGKLIHISTNCVFKNIGPHNETEQPNAIDLYGMSKAFGEIDDDHNLTIRTSIIGPELKQNGIGLMHKFINDENFIYGYEDIFWNGVTTLELSKFIVRCIEHEKTGLINYYTKPKQKTDYPKIVKIFSDIYYSKFDLLNIINKEFNLNRHLCKIKGNNVHQSLLTGPNYTTKSYEEQIKELKTFMEINKNENSNTK